MEWWSRTRLRVVVASIFLIGAPLAVGVGREQGWYPKDQDWRVCETRADLVPRTPCYLTEDGQKWVAVLHKKQVILYTPREGR